MNNGGSVITDYIIEYKPASGSWTTFADGTSTTLTATITGLTNGTSYTFRVSAVNALGTSTVSSISNAVTPVTTPDKPTITSAISAAPGQATITFTAPGNNGGSAITLYTIVSNEGHFATTTTPGSVTITGLINGAHYTFTITATNDIGMSIESDPSDIVTPASTPNAPTGLIAVR